MRFVAPSGDIVACDLQFIRLTGDSPRFNSYSSGSRRWRQPTESNRIKTP